MNKLKMLAVALATTALVLGGSLAHTQIWTPLTHPAPFSANAPLLLTDGTVMVQDTETPNWWRLTPDENGSYVNGTWTQLASMASSYGPLYHASAVLRDGRVIIEGGEYNLSGNGVWTTKGSIYDPVANSWTSMSPPSGWTTIGDAQSIVLPDGTFMLANCCTTQQALLNSSTLTWNTLTNTGKFDDNDEEGWTLLPKGRVLAVDAYVGAYNSSGTNSELFNPSTGTWSTAGSTGVQLWDSCGGANAASYELGPALLRPDGTVFATGANNCAAGHTSVYHPGSKTWTPGPDIPNGNDIADGPAALLPNGHVLVDTSPGVFNQGTSFYEFNGTKFTQVPGPPNSIGDSSFYGTMLVLPTGQILFTDFSSDVEIYTSSATYKPAWVPTITSLPHNVVRGNTYKVTGTQFNGLSQGAAYGDDEQTSTNYPLVRITNDATAHVFYARTFRHSTMAVATGTKSVSTHFEVPLGMEAGPSTLVVVANGIPSAPSAVTVH
ncbi:MAG: hypothetical protein WB952_25040 [Terriglobales bacterium]